MFRRSIALFVLFSVVLTLGAIAPPAHEDSVVSIRIRFHLMVSDDSEVLNCSFTEDEIEAHLREANRFWEQAGVRWEIDRIVRRKVQGSEKLDEYMALDVKDVDERTAMLPKVRSVLESLMPDDGWINGCLDVVLLETVGPYGGGFYDNNGRIYLARYRVTDDDPHMKLPPVVLAHEFGHALGLRHAPCELEDNFMLGRCDSRDGSEDDLTDEQIETARGKAIRVMKRQQARLKPNDD